MWASILGFLKPLLESVIKELVSTFAFTEKKKTTIKETEDHAKGPDLDLSDHLDDDLLSDDLV